MRLLDALIGATTLASTAAAQFVSIAPDDPNLTYRGYVNATIDSSRAHFDRLPVVATGQFHSPGVRIDFVSDATRIDVRVDYIGTFGTSGAGQFRVEVDGVLTAAMIGSDSAIGVQSYTVFQQPSPTPRVFSLIYPFASNVDFLGLDIEGGTLALLGAPPAPPGFLHVAYGDSITHGFYATSIAEGYPYRVARAEAWSQINLGFFGQNVDPVDGTLVGSLGGDLVTLAIGVNDWFYDTPVATFLANYAALLDNIRAVQPDVRILALTPIWTDRDGLLNQAGMTVEGYRQAIRDVVLPRTTTDPELYLMEGRVLVPPGTSFVPDGVHPNDAGFAFYAAALSDDNRIVEPGFETGGFAWTDLGGSGVESTNPNSGAAALRVGPGAGAAEQPLGRVRRGLTYRFSAWAHVTAVGTSGEIAVVFYDELGGELQRSAVAVSGTTYTELGTLLRAPAQFAEVRLECAQVGGSGALWVDDLELLDVSDVPPRVYCVAKTNSLGCVPSIGSIGSSSASSLTATFDVIATNVLNQRNGLLFYGYGSASISPFNGGTLCVLPPLRRLPIQNAGGTLPPTMDCSGTYTFEFNAHTQSGTDPFLSPGQQVNAQWWSRDPQHVDGTGAGLTDGLEFIIGN